jgi:enoyl-CoA hydratase/carnithine racemase
MGFAALSSFLVTLPLKEFSECRFSRAPGSTVFATGGRGRALEVLLSAEDYDAEMAERYGWINRALPAARLCDFVKSLARRIDRFPAFGVAAIRERVNAVALAPADDFRRDSSLFLECVREPESQNRIKAAMRLGFQTREAEMDLPSMLVDLPDNA